MKVRHTGVVDAATSSLSSGNLLVRRTYHPVSVPTVSCAPVGDIPPSLHDGRWTNDADNFRERSFSEVTSRCGYRERAPHRIAGPQIHFREHEAAFCTASRTSGGRPARFPSSDARRLRGVAPSFVQNPTLSVCRHSRRAAGSGRLDRRFRPGVAGGVGLRAAAGGPVRSGRASSHARV
jgi:hypothetical protein